jgi:hypothetical protein
MRCDYSLGSFQIIHGETSACLLLRTSFKPCERSCKGSGEPSIARIVRVNHPLAVGFDKLPAVRDDAMDTVTLRNAMIRQLARLALVIEAKNLEVGGDDGLIAA